MKDDMKAVGYIRVSTEDQSREGVSLDAQRARIEAWATLNDATLIESFVDAGLSGGRADNRPGLQAALALACKEKAVLVVYSLSRLARSTRDAITISERLDKAGADMVSLSEKIDTTSAAGKMIYRMLAVLAEFERDQVSERTALAMGHKRSLKEFGGGEPPYGWRLTAEPLRIVRDRKGIERPIYGIEPEPAEQSIIEQAKVLRDQGMSLRAVGRALQSRGMLPRKAPAWDANTVRSLLRAA